MTAKREKPLGTVAVKIVRRTLADGTVKTYEYRKRERRERVAGALRRIFNAYSESPEFLRLCEAWRAQKLRHFNLIEDRLGWMQIADLDDRSARTEFFALRDAHAAVPHRADKMMATLASALAWAYDRAMIGYNHAARIPRVAELRREVTIYTPEMQTALGCFADTDLDRVAALALYTGARRADLLGLRWDQIDRDGWLTFTPSKTARKTGVTVALPTRALTPLAALLDAMPRRGATILTRASGAPWNDDVLTREWGRRVRAAEMTGMRFHDWRHTTATRLVEAGCTEAERGAVLGHAVAHGAGPAYVARTRALSENAYRKWNSAMAGGVVVPLENGRRKTAKTGR